MKISELNHAMRVIDLLKGIAHKLHKLDEGYCNTERGERAQKTADTRTQNLINRATELADMLGLKVFHQGDPRGASLYLCEPEYCNRINYTRGIAL